METFNCNVYVAFLFMNILIFSIVGNGLFLYFFINLMNGNINVERCDKEDSSIQKPELKL